ncbi:MAG: aminotransferase class III-fold pyridoxal phosphate-dependent enzyme, partial [Verrucomicrobia bacterium]|nr:aminotransferase class III-fold pyridoxal phosphate-dependent enzyme [Verrucomicrobiota bacterium]
MRTKVDLMQKEQESPRWARSREYLARARKSLCGGVSSPFRAKAPVPLYLEDAHGSRIRDVDGNEYIDYSLAWGPLILGHAHPAIVSAIQEHAAKPHIFGAQHLLEFEVSEAIQRAVPCAERVAFTSSGSEAVQIALRLARAFTGRNLIVKFEGHYHGWMDSVLLSYKPKSSDLRGSDSFQGLLGSRGQVPNAVDNVVIARWNDLASVEAVFREFGPDVAAIVAEPVACNSGCLPAEPNFLESIARLARANGSLVMFDEIITGFRHRAASVQAAIGLFPDIATLGKALGGGLTLSA